MAIWKQTEFEFTGDLSPDDSHYRRFFEQAPEPLQPELPMGKDESGYTEWHREHTDLVRGKINRICREWSVPLFKHVELTFKNIPGVYCGKLILAEYPKEPYDHRKGPLTLAFDEFELGKPQFQFLSDEIETGRVIQ